MTIYYEYIPITIRCQALFIPYPKNRPLGDFLLKRTLLEPILLLQALNFQVRCFDIAVY